MVQFFELHQIRPEHGDEVAAEDNVRHIGDLGHDEVDAFGIFGFVNKGIQQVHVNMLAVVQRIAAGQIHDKNEGVAGEFFRPAGGGFQHKAVKHLCNKAYNQEEEKNITDYLFKLDEAFIEAVELLNKITIHCLVP